MAGVAVLIVLAVGAAAASVQLQRSPAPLSLPTTAAQPPAGPTDATWNVASGSLAGFRVRETFLWMSNDVVGRTGAVTGTVVISGSRVTAAAFRIGLSTLTVRGKKQPQFANSLGTRQYPDASFTLTKAAGLPGSFTSGATVTTQAVGQLTMHGVSRTVSFPVSGRRDGAAIQLIGSIPVTFAAWNIKGPAGGGSIGSLASQGTAEFLLILDRR